MATTDPITGAVLDDSSSNVPTFPARLVAAVAKVSGFVVARFTNATARTAAIPAPVAGQVTWLTSILGWQGFDGTRWAPLVVRKRYSAAGGSAGSIAGTPNPALIVTCSVPTQPGPYRAVVSGKLNVNSSDNSRWLLLLRTAATGGISSGGIGGSDVDYDYDFITATEYHTFHVDYIYESADGTAQDFGMLLARQTGIGLAGVNGDAKQNRVDVLVEPM